MVDGGKRTVWTGRLAAIGLLSVALGGCQALKDALPTKSSEPSPAPSQSPLAIPVVMPNPTPTPVLGGPSTNPTPGPSPSTSPNPTPAPSDAPPGASACNLPPSNNPDAPCTMQSESFLKAVDDAITLLTQQKPSLFDMNQKTCDNCYFVKDQTAFVNGVMKNLSAAGYCAYYDGEELAVKNSNSFNDQYDILVSSGHIRRGAGSYRSTCNPSWF
jgi:hypothetical protein